MTKICSFWLTAVRQGVMIGLITFFSSYLATTFPFRMINMKKKISQKATGLFLKISIFRKMGVFWERP